MKQKLDQELEALNAEVSAALAKRKEWMDANMENYAKVKVGEDIYDLQTGQLLGKVVSLYRYSAKHNPLYDTQMIIEYAFETSPNCIDNTSRHGVYTEGRFGTRDEARRRFELAAAALAMDFTDVTPAPPAKQ